MEGSDTTAYKNRLMYEIPRLRFTALGMTKIGHSYFAETGHFYFALT